MAALAEAILMVGSRQVVVGTNSNAQVSTNATVLVTNSEVDARGWRSLAYTISVITNAVTWSVWGANVSDYSDEVAVLAPVSVAGAANSSYSTSQAPFSFYRVKIIDTSGGSHGTATIGAIVKN